MTTGQSAACAIRRRRAYGLGLQIGRAAFRMTGGAKQPRRFFLGNDSVNDTGIFTVDTADAAEVLQLLQRPVQVPVTQHHGGVGHVHLEGGDALAEHFRQLCANGFVPVINGHVETIVTVRPAIGLTVPELQSVLKAFTLIGTGKVNDGGGAAPQRRTAAESKIIRRSGAADVQLKVGMCVNKAGEQGDSPPHPQRNRPFPK